MGARNAKLFTRIAPGRCWINDLRLLGSSEYWGAMLRHEVKARWLWLLTLLLLCGSVQAQYVVGGMRYTCPVGANWDDPRCIRDAFDAGANSPRDSRRWKLTWGAIVVDSTTGDVGTATGEFSKHDAERQALARCWTRGAEKCELLLSYEHQCAVIVWPGPNTGRVVAQGAATIDRATELALPKCEQLGGRDCKVLYSDCTKPVLDQ